MSTGRVSIEFRRLFVGCARLIVCIHRGTLCPRPPFPASVTALPPPYSCFVLLRRRRGDVGGNSGYRGGHGPFPPAGRDFGGVAQRHRRVRWAHRRYSERCIVSGGASVFPPPPPGGRRRIFFVLRSIELLHIGRIKLSC